jgi:hypothetical protein
MRLRRLIVLSWLATLPTVAVASPTPSAQEWALAHLRPTPASEAGLRVAERPLPHGWSAVVVHQQHQGLPVLGAEQVLLRDPSGRLVSSTGSLPPYTAGTPIAPWTSRAALEPALGEALRHGLRAVGSQRAWRLGAEGALQPMWQLDLAGAGRPPRLVQLLIDGRDGRVLSVRPRWQRASGWVYPTNPVTSELSLEPIERLLVPGELRSPAATVVSCDLGPFGVSCRSEALTDELGDFSTRPAALEVPDGFAEVNAYWHIDQLHQWFRSWGLGAGLLDGPGAIEAWVNVTDFDNAGYAPAGSFEPGSPGIIVLGQAGGRDYAYDGDVIRHEYTHALIDATVGLEQLAQFPGEGVDHFPGALNEAYADLFSCTTEGDAVVGEYISGVDGVRRLDTDLRCPDDVVGEVHQDSLPFSQALWSVRQRFESDDAFGQFLFVGLMALSRTSGFAEAAAAHVAVARGMQGDELADALQAAFEHRGVTDCGRFVPLGEGDSHLGWLESHYEYTGGLAGGPWPGVLQYVVQVPDDAVAVRARIEPTSYGAWSCPGCSLALYGRSERPVTWSPRFNAAGSVTALDPRADASDSGGELRFELDGRLPLSPGTVLYLAPVNRDSRSFGYLIELAIEHDPGDQGGDADVDGDADSDQDGGGGEVDTPGCRCNSVPGDRTPVAIASWALLIGLALLRRR